MNDRLRKQLDFVVEIDKCKNIFRQNYLCDGLRHENDAEHSWHIAIMAFLFSEYAPSGTDIKRVMQMCLIHDIVEIDAGDTYAYDTEGIKSQAEREQKAADRLFGILPEDQGAFVRGLWDEFEERKTDEAVLARAMDCLQPLLLNSTSGGKSWKEHNVHASQVRKRMQAVNKCSPELYDVAEGIIEKAIEEGLILPD